MEVWILSYSFTIHLFVIMIFGILLGFFYRGERNPMMKSIELTVFLSIAFGLFGPAGRTVITTILFGIGFYYGWVIRGNVEDIESFTKKTLFLLSAALLALIIAYFTAVFFEI